MKYCSKCGKELRDEAVICVACGCSVASNPSGYSSNDNPTTANLSVVFAFLIPIVGFILGLIGMQKYTNEVLRNRSKAGLCFSIAVFLICTLIYSVIIQMGY